MRDHAIAPTAQRLAEENNVDWRVLEGSGEGGSVVERDVLGYLARVMQGDEATNPTPEPLPEGLSAWPEEPERRRNPQGQNTQRNPQGQKQPGQNAPSRSAQGQTAPNAATNRTESQNGKTSDGSPFTVPAPVMITQPVPEAEPNTPWTVEPAKAAAPSHTAADDKTADAGEAVSKDIVFDGTVSDGTVSDGTVSDGAAPQGDFNETAVQAGFEVDEPAPEEVATPSASLDSEDSDALFEELVTLRARVAELEDERSKHVNELHQLSRMQETIALQKNEGAKLGALQSEVRDLKAQLTAAQRAGERVEALAAHNRDLESRLVRARNFKSKAKTEFERITEDNMMLEHELADLKRSKRGLFRRRN